MISQIAYDNKDLTNAEQQIFTLVSEYPSYEEWKYKGFLLSKHVPGTDLFKLELLLKA